MESVNLYAIKWINILTFDTSALGPKKIFPNSRCYKNTNIFPKLFEVSIFYTEKVNPPFNKMKKGLWMDNDGSTSVWMHLIPLNCTLENGQDGKLYVYFIKILKKFKKKLT